MDFIIELSILTNLKNKIYNSIPVIINYLKKMIYYNLIKVTIDILGLVNYY